MYELKYQHKFSAAHHLENYKGECSNVHGHTWIVDILVRTESLNNDMVLDFKDIKKVIDDRFDHKDINTMVTYNPTAENISKDIYDLILNMLSKLASSDDSTEVKITVWESDKAGITYYIPKK